MDIWMGSMRIGWWDDINSIQYIVVLCLIHIVCTMFPLLNISLFTSLFIITVSCRFCRSRTGFYLHTITIASRDSLLFCNSVPHFLPIPVSIYHQFIDWLLFAFRNISLARRST
jgi:hypothetical protein